MDDLDCGSDTSDYCDSGTCVGPCGNQYCLVDPIIIDLGGTGFQLTDAKDGVKFDFQGKGDKDLISWTAANWNGGWLALDRNGNGKIDNGTELFGNVTPQPTPAKGALPNGFLALAVYDLSHDGVIDAKDPIFSKLVIWIDRNHNGISEPSELISLAQAGVKSISLNYAASQFKDANRNTFRYKSQISDATKDSTIYDVVLMQAVPNKAHGGNE